MFFLGLVGEAQQATLTSALIAVYGADNVVLVAQRVDQAPPELARQLAAVQVGGSQPLDSLGQLHVALGQWIGAVALTTLAEAGVPAQAVELTGCRSIQLAGGLALGDLAAAGQHSRLTIIAVREAAGAEGCARAAWTQWQSTRQQPAAQPTTQSLTEDRNPTTLDIDLLPTLELLRLINQEDSLVARAVGSQLPQIADAVDRITERMQRGGRMIYVGAGTSGRIGTMDASEIPPTYGASRDLVVALIAGGDIAIQHSLEGVEDDEAAAAQSIAELQVDQNDTVVGIAASGRTPYVLGAMQEARKRGALLIAVACNSPSPMAALADVSIAPLVGPEVITGSTRMKAGTAQKMVLNMLSTGIMVRLGKTFSNLMVDMQTTNQKLHNRARHIVAQACGITEEEASQALRLSGGEMKTAIVAVLASITPEAARQRLARHGGIVRRALATPAEVQS